MPAVYKLLEKINESEKAIVLLICGNPDDRFKKFKSVSFKELPNVTFYISPYRTLNIPGFRGLISNCYHLLVFLKFALKKFTFIYCDREHVIYGGLLSLLKKKVILRLHGVANLNTKPLFKWGVIPRFRLWFFRAPFKKIICSIDGSPGMAFINKRCSIKSSYHLLYNGVDLPSTSEKSPIINFDLNSKPVITSIGRLDKSKGNDLLLKSLAEVKNERWQCVIVGAGEEEQELKELCQKLDIIDRVIFTGSLSRNEVFTLLEKSDIFVSLNKYGNQSNAVLEAMKAGKCILTYEPCLEAGRDLQFIENHELTDSMVLCKRENLTETLSLIIQNQNLISEKSKKMKNYAEKNILSWNERITKELNLIMDDQRIR